MSVDNLRHTAVLTFNSFDNRQYTRNKLDFKAFVRDAFARIQRQGVQHLILDIRQNGGGNEGFEDYVLSFLLTQDYTKYAYVQASGFRYSFYPYTNYRYTWPKLEQMLRQEHVRASDGRILRRPGVEEHEKPQTRPYRGKLYVLTSGLTYSGGAELAALLKNYTSALFIGEEVGGGYYGNTSGNRLVLRLPNTGLEVGIPLLKFVLTTPVTSVPEGHGVLPDYPTQATIDQVLAGYDVALQTAYSLINHSFIPSVR